MTLTNKPAVAFLITSILCTAIALFAFSYSQVAVGSAPSGLSAFVASSTVRNLTTSPSLLMATSSSNCSARIITTASSTVFLTFSDRYTQPVSSSNGHIQLASTTVAYDSGIYGCDAINVISLGIQTVTVTETR